MVSSHVYSQFIICHVMLKNMMVNKCFSFLFFKVNVINQI